MTQVQAWFGISSSRSPTAGGSAPSPTDPVAVLLAQQLELEPVAADDLGVAAGAGRRPGLAQRLRPGVDDEPARYRGRDDRGVDVQGAVGELELPPRLLTVQ